jgi:hypothetical protein
MQLYYVEQLLRSGMEKERGHAEWMMQEASGFRMYVCMYVCMYTPRPTLPTHAWDGVIEIYHGYRYLHGAAEERSGLVQKGKEGRVAGPGIVVISQFRNPRTEKLLVVGCISGTLRRKGYTKWAASCGVSFGWHDR